MVAGWGGSIVVGEKLGWSTLAWRGTWCQLVLECELRQLKEVGMHLSHYVLQQLVGSGFFLATSFWVVSQCSSSVEKTSVLLVMTDE